MPTLVRRGLAVFLALHGIAHVLGFLASWRLAEFADVPYTTTVLNGALDVGDAGIRVVGLLWLAGGAACVAAAIALLRGSMSAVAVLLGASLAICLLGLPASIIGVWIDAALLAALGALALLRPALLRPSLR